MKYQNQQQHEAETEIRIYRSFAMPLSAFEYLKKYQRSHHAETGELRDNSLTLAAILEEHKALVTANQLLEFHLGDRRHDNY